jgi:hypothetical protein
MPKLMVPSMLKRFGQAEEHDHTILCPVYIVGMRIESQKMKFTPTSPKSVFPSINKIICETQNALKIGKFH